MSVCCVFPHAQAIDDGTEEVTIAPSQMTSDYIVAGLSIYLVK